MTALAGRPSAICARGLRVRLGGVEILPGVDLALPTGRWTAVVGPNGAGKSTLLRGLAGLVASSGAVELLGRPVAAMPGRERARRLAWLGQGEVPSGDLRTYDLVMLGRLPHLAWLASPGPVDHAVVEQALRATQAWDWRDRPVGQLSGGERQRVLLARAPAGPADVLLMGEPLGNLDPPHQADWLALVRQQVAQGRTVVTVLHELTMALGADALVIVAGGSVRWHGACEDPATHRALEQVFEQRIRIHPLGGQWVALPR